MNDDNYKGESFERFLRGMVTEARENLQEKTFTDAEILKMQDDMLDLDDHDPDALVHAQAAGWIKKHPKLGLYILVPPKSEWKKVQQQYVADQHNGAWCSGEEGPVQFVDGIKKENQYFFTQDEFEDYLEAGQDPKKNRRSPFYIVDLEMADSFGWKEKWWPAYITKEKIVAITYTHKEFWAKVKEENADQEADQEAEEKAERDKKIADNKAYEKQALDMVKASADNKAKQQLKMELDKRNKLIEKGKKVPPTPPKPVLGRWNHPIKGDIHDKTFDRAKSFHKEVDAWNKKYRRTLSKYNMKDIINLEDLAKKSMKEIKGLKRWWKSKKDDSVYLKWQKTLQLLGGEFDRIKVLNFKEKNGVMSGLNESFEQMLRNMVTESREEIKRENKGENK